jgi:hypothetical protein
MTWRLHIERPVAKALGTYIRTYSLFKSKRLTANIKLIVYRALIRSILTYACPTWEFVADTHLWKLQRLQNRVLRAIGDLDRRTLVRDLHVAFKIPYVYDYITKLCGWQQKPSKITKTQMYVQLDREKPYTENTWVKLGGGQAYHCSSDWLQFRSG